MSDVFWKFQKNMKSSVKLPKGSTLQWHFKAVVGEVMGKSQFTGSKSLLLLLPFLHLIVSGRWWTGVLLFTSTKKIKILWSSFKYYCNNIRRSLKSFLQWKFGYGSIVVILQFPSLASSELVFVLEGKQINSKYVETLSKYPLSLYDKIPVIFQQIIPSFTPQKSLGFRSAISMFRNALLAHQTLLLSKRCGESSLI